MLNKHLPRILRLVLANPARIPQFTRDPEILTAADERVRATPLGGGRNAVRGEIVLFAAGDGDEPGYVSGMFAWVYVPQVIS